MTGEVIERSGLVRLLYGAAGIVLTVLGIVGLILPVMPGVIFLVLAAAAFARSSPRLEARLLNHPRVGPAILAWRRHGAIPPKAKVSAIVAMAASLVILVFTGLALWITGLIAIVLAGAGGYILSRPDGPPEAAASVEG